MPRKRLREWPQQTIKFRAWFPIPRPAEGEPTDLQQRKLIPQVVYERAQAMRHIWNECVAAHETFLQGEPHNLPKEEKNAAYTAFNKQLYDLCKTRGDELRLGAWQKWHVFDTFTLALKAFWKGQRERPKHHHVLDRILVPYRTESGGVELDWLWRQIEPVPANAYEKRVRDEMSDDDAVERRSDERANRMMRHTSAKVPLGNASVNMYVALHQQIPPGAIVKRLAISGEQIKPFAKPGNWLWHLLVTVEIPPGDYYKELPATNRAGGIDFGWRTREDGIRVAVVYDGRRAWELVMPFDLAPNRIKRHQKRLAEHGRTVEMTRNWREVFKLQEDRDANKDQCKDALKLYNPADWPERSRQLFMRHSKRCWTHNEKMGYDKQDRGYHCPIEDCAEQVRGGLGIGGMRALRQSLFDNGGIILPGLESWFTRDEELGQRIRNAQICIKQRQDVIYRTFAHWLVTQFDALAWEGDLNLQEMAEGRRTRKAERRQEREAEDQSEARQRTSEEIALDLAEKNRQFASLYRLRQFIQQAFDRYQRNLIDYQTAYSTQTCPWCGAHVEPGVDLTLSCDGQDTHRADQDIIAAQNYHGIAAAELQEVPASGASVQLSQLNGMVRPLS
ncbi:MAG: hypothetical protein MOB07_23180 [Acidobacteria bacterium]|nr:hypothetical protein [Acidobacteriota bacterium]